MKTFLLFILFAACLNVHAAPSMVVTSDLEGRLLPCAACPAASGYPGLARIASGIADLRSRHTDLLFVDAGNALMGSDSAATRGALAAEALMRLRPDAMNISHRDFRFGAARLLEVLAESGLPAVSANVRAADGARLFEPFRTVRGTPVVGLTEPPAGMAFLPHLRQQLDGVEIVDPAAALRELAPRLPGSGPVVLLYYGGPRGASDLAKVAAEVFAGREVRMGLSGGAADARVDGVEITVAVSDGKSLAVSGRAEPLDVTALEPEPALTALFRERLQAQTPAETRGTEPAGADMDLSAGPQVLSPPVRGNNRGFSVSVFGVELLDELAGDPAPNGMKWLVMDARFVNDQAIDLLLELNYEEALLLGPLHRQLFAVVNGVHARPAVRPDSRVPGVLPDSVRLLNTGDGVRGRVAFVVPDEPVYALSLHYYHDLFPPLRAELMAAPDREEVTALHQGISENQMEVWVTAVEETESLNGVSAPEGMVWLAVDVKGEGQRMDEIDALAVERGADPNDTVANARVTDYLRADDLLQVVADGRDRSVRDPVLSTLPMNPTFLPDVRTGGRMVFPVPADAKALELVFDFPEYQRAAGAQFPDPIRFTLRGDPQAVPEPAVLARIEDNPLPLEILSARWRENPVALEVEVQIRNVSGTGGMYKGVQRARLRMPDGSILQAASTHFRGGMPFDDELWLPPRGEPRRFWFVFEPETAARRVDFHYNGVTSGGTVPIDFENGTVRAEAVDMAEADPSVEPDGLAAVVEARDDDAAAPDSAKADQRPAPSLPPLEFPLSRLAEDPEQEPPEHPIALNLSGQNEQISVEIPHAFLFESIHGTPVEDGRVMLGVHVTLQRRSDTDAGRDQHYTQRNWEDTVFVVDGGGRLIPADSVRNDPLSMPSGVRLQRTGRVAEGILYFPIAPENLGHVELHWLDAEYGHMHFPIFPVGETVPEPDPLVAGTNQLASVQVHGTWSAEEFEGRSNSGMVWRVFDVRGRSLRTPVGTNRDAEVLRPRDWQERVFLLLDGRHLFSIPSRGTDLPDLWHFLPQRHAGGRIAFSLPEGVWDASDSAELLFGFGPHTVGPGERLTVPELIRIPVKGTPVAPAVPEEVLARDLDVDLDLRITGYDFPEDIPGSRSGRVWFAVDLLLNATHPEGAFLDPTHRFKLLSSNGSVYRPIHLFWGEKNHQSARGMSERWFPPGVEIPLRMVWRIPEEEQKNLRLLHGGVRTYALHPVGPQDEAEPVPALDLSSSGHGIRLWDLALEPKGLEGVGLTPEQVNEAIDRGREFLWEHLQTRYTARGRLSGRRYMIISLYALVNVEAHKIYPEFDELLREYLHRVNPNQLQVYEIGLLAMIIRAYGDPEFHEKLEQISRWLVEAQGEKGTWHYSADVPDHFFPSLAEDGADAGEVFAVEGGRAPMDRRDLREPMHRTISFRQGRDGDNSTTQFAVLGLWSIERAGMRLDPDVWERTLIRAAINQSLDMSDDLGGFGYRGMARNTYGAMTAAGLCTYALAMRHLDADADVRRHPRILNALGWLANQFSVSDHPNKNGTHYYYLYSLERVGQILGTEFIGEHEWYPLGAKHLVDTQSAAGSWPTRSGESNSALTTSYALLFLVRATPSMDEDIIPEEPEGPATLVTSFTSPPPPPRLYLIFDASGSMRAPLENVTKFDMARDAVRELVDALPDGVEFAMRVYGHRYNALHDDAVRDSELVLPFAPLDRALINETLDSLRPVGRTPLAFSLDEARGDLRGGRGAETLVVLFTDGGDDTRSNPVASAAAYRDLDSVTFRILGFDINRPNWTRQLKGMAEASGGVYMPVEDAANLARDLVAIVSPPPPAFRLLTPEGELVAEGRFGDTLDTLEPGEYRMETTVSDSVHITEFWLHPGRSTRLAMNWEQAAGL